MPSRAERSVARPVQRRVAVELGLRTAAVLLAMLAVRALLVPQPTATLKVSGSALARVLPQLVAQRDGAVHVEFEALPAAPERDLLAALVHAGTRVTWTSRNIAPLAMSVERLREPAAPVRLAAVSNSAVELSDAVGPLDTIPPGSGVVVVANPAEELRVRSLGQRTPATAAGARAAAHVAVPRAGGLKPVLVLARASWESKFVVAALEEAGWRVATRISVAPGVVVVQQAGDTPPRSQIAANAPVAFDSSRYGAVIVLDSGQLTTGAALTRFVAAGGGALLGPAAARDPGLKALGFLSARGAVSVRRVGAGRVAQIGDSATWRQRLEGNENGPVAHRAWWSRTVASVMPTAASDMLLDSDDPAPLAQIIQALGPASEVGTPTLAWTWGPGQWLLPLILIVLLAEWASRRRRGAL